jgi:electron transfer flavoprotein alpha subunit
LSGVLVIAETRRGELREISLELIACARGLAQQGCSPVVVAAIDRRPDLVADGLNVEGVDRVVLVESPREHWDAGLAGDVVIRLMQELSPEVVLIGHTVDGMGLGPAIAARTGSGFASDALAITWEDGRPVVERGAYADRLVARLKFGNRAGSVVMVRPGAYDPVTAGGGTAAVGPATFSLDDSAATTEHVDFQAPETGDVDISKATFLLGVGRGIEEADNIPRFEELAETLGATLAVSRPLVDAGWVHPSRQVGQSGKTVKPRIYLALGISGAVQHLAGMRKSNTIIAVNTDPDAPIFKVAHYGAVADLFEIAEALPEHFR